MSLRFKVEPKITLSAEYEEAPVRGNVSASGHDAFDKKVEDEILARLRDGDVWAWASVTVTASLYGLEEHAYLGCCSYESAEDFVKSSDYYPDMVAEVKGRLLETIELLMSCVEEG